MTLVANDNMPIRDRISCFLQERRCDHSNNSDCKLVNFSGGKEIVKLELFI